MGTTAQVIPTPVGSICTVVKTSDGEHIVTGDQSLLREVFESSPEQWLRCLALKDTKDGKTKK